MKLFTSITSTFIAYASLHQSAAQQSDLYPHIHIKSQQ